MTELTDEQIKGIFLNAGYVTQWSTKDIHPISYRAARDLIAADRARRQAEQEPAAAIAALERIAGDLQALCDKQALMLGELEAQLEAVGAGGVSAMMPRQLAVECDGDWSAAYQHPALRRAEIAVRDAKITALKAERDALKQDAERLDWLDQNIFSRENINFMGQLDPTMNMWVTFSPKGHQGSARNILDAAMQAQEVKPS